MMDHYLLPDRHDEDDDYSFENLCDDLNEMRRQREAREAAQALAFDREVTDAQLASLRKSLEAQGHWPPSDRPAPRPYLSAVDISDLPKEIRNVRFDPNGELQRKLSDLLATEDQLQKADRAREAAAQVRRRAARVEQHRELVREQIPQLLSKALEIQKRGGCTALDVARVTAECHHLAERWL